jgi:dipeptidyl aminopeptidase/acylaminoacyl peptidase
MMAPAPMPSRPASGSPRHSRLGTAARRVPLLAVPLFGLGLAVQCYRAIRAYRAEQACFRPARGALGLPTDIDGAPPPHPVSFRTADGTTLAGWYLPSRNRAAVVYAHGSSGDRRSLWPEARLLSRAGYGALLFDFPGHGESGGVVTWGRNEQAALVAAVDLVAAQPDVDPARIGAFGFSMGGYITAQVAAKDRRLRAVVLLGAPSDAEEQTRYEYDHDGRLAQAAALWAVRRAGMDLTSERPIDVVRAIAPRSLFVIGGGADRVVSPDMTRALFAAAGEPKTLWVAEGAGHGDLAKIEPVQYPARLRSFFDGALTPESGGAAPR